MIPEQIWNIVINPAWRSFTVYDMPGFVLLTLAAIALVGLTVWTYLGNPQTTGRRLTTLVVLRLSALFLAILTALRPAISITDQPKIPSSFIIVIDASESMSVKDEYNDQTRWQLVQKVMNQCQPILEQLQEEQQVTVYQYRFAKDFNPTSDKYDASTAKPDGKRTDFGTMLYELYNQHQSEEHLRGILIISDGADNGVAKPPMAEATKWRGIGCPIYTFGVGQASTRSDLRDLAITSISPDPAPVAVKSDLKVKGLVNAQGFEGAAVSINLLMDDQLIKTERFQLLKSVGNEIEIAVKAPEKSGEVKLTLRIDEKDKPPGEVTLANNSIETYLTVTKEGVRILVIDKLRPELGYIRNAIASDKRFDWVEVIRQTDAPLLPGDKKVDFENEAYDVILLGDITAKSIRGISEDFLEKIATMVRDKGVGLMMLGGRDSFGGTRGVPGSGDWAGTSIAQLLPVEFTLSDVIEKFPTKILPTQRGYQHYIMRLDADSKKNQEIWDRLNRNPRSQMSGYSPFSRVKDGAIILAETVGKNNPREPLFVGFDFSKTRTLAFGGDTLHRWRLLGLENKQNPREGLDHFTRFWKQTMLWLAHQDEVEGSVYARPELRRLAINAKQTIRMGVRDKRGEEIPNASILYQILMPGEEVDKSKAKPASRDGKGQILATYEAKAAGEYRVAVWGEGKAEDGSTITGDAQARFIVYPEVSDEMLRPAANHDFLIALENTANSTLIDQVRKADKLPSFLEDLKANPLKPALIKPNYYPDWRRNANPWFLPLVLVLFATILGMEWGLRRLWGMV